MSVKDAVKVLKYAKQIRLAWSGTSVRFDASDNIQLNAYGSYKVDYILSAPSEGNNDECYEIGICILPVGR